MNDTKSVWERLPGEPSRWFDRFHRFLLLGPGRSVYAVSKAETGRTSITRDWREASRRWDWVRRAEAWDDAQARQERLAFERARRENRRKRLELLECFQTKIEGA